MHSSRLRSYGIRDKLLKFFETRRDRNSRFKTLLEFTYKQRAYNKYKKKTFGSSFGFYAELLQNLKSSFFRFEIDCNLVVVVSPIRNKVESVRSTRFGRTTLMCHFSLIFYYDLYNFHFNSIWGVDQLFGQQWYISIDASNIIPFDQVCFAFKNIRRDLLIMLLLLFILLVICLMKIIYHSNQVT